MYFDLWTLAFDFNLFIEFSNFWANLWIEKMSTFGRFEFGQRISNWGHKIVPFHFNCTFYGSKCYIKVSWKWRITLKHPPTVRRVSNFLNVHEVRWDDELVSWRRNTNLPSFVSVGVRCTFSDITQIQTLVSAFNSVIICASQQTKKLSSDFKPYNWSSASSVMPNAYALNYNIRHWLLPIVFILIHSSYEIPKHKNQFDETIGLRHFRINVQFSAFTCKLRHY